MNLAKGIAREHMRTDEQPIIGRPSKRTPDTFVKLKQAVALGMTWRRAALAVGVEERTLRRWREDPAIRAELSEAEAQGEGALLGRIGAGVQGWQGAAWILERR